MPAPTRPSQASQQPGYKGQQQNHLLGNAAAICWGASAKDKHGQGNKDEDQLDMLAIDLLGGESEESKFIFHGKHPFWVWFNFLVNSTPPQASKQASKLKQNQPGRAGFSGVNTIS
jgi:hypothetical protein